MPWPPSSETHGVTDFPAAKTGSVPPRIQAVAIPLVIRALKACPLPLLETIFGGISLARALTEPRRVARALARANSQGRVGIRRWSLVLRLLVNRGRFLALAAAPAVVEPEALRGRLYVEGATGFESGPQGTGRIVLTFHLGPGLTGVAMALQGLTTTGSGEGWSFENWPLPKPSWRGIPHVASVLWRADDTASRAVAMHQLYRLLADGHTVRLPADGGVGGELFAMPLPGGGRLVIRAGWWVLRRRTAVPVFPVLCHQEGRRIVVVVHPPLPPVGADAAEDLAVCRAALSALIADYVQRFPAQCVTPALGTSQDQTASRSACRLCERDDLPA